MRRSQKIKLCRLVEATLIILATIVVVSKSSSAADIYLATRADVSFDETFDPLGCQIKIEGQIELGDLEKLKKLYSTGITADNSGEMIGYGPTLCLSSPGGSLAEAVKIASFIKDNHGTTLVPPSAHCESACAILFMAGNIDFAPDRRMFTSSKIGFHAPALTLSGSTYQPDDIQRAYDLAIFTIAVVSELEILTPYVMTLFSATPNSEMKYLETVDDLNGAIVQLTPRPRAPKITFEEMIANVCQYVYGKDFYGRDLQFRPKDFGDPVKIISISTEKSSYFSGIVVEGEAFINVGEDSYEPSCRVDFRISDDFSAGGVSVELYDSESQVEPLFLWPGDALITDLPNNAMDQFQLNNLIYNHENSKSNQVVNCWLESYTGRITNVDEYTNLRRQPDLVAPDIREIPLGELVSLLRFDNLTVVGGERDRQSCINACQAFARNSEDRAARDRVQQCISDNMLWYEITDAGGNRGWVSRRFLEDVE